MLQSKKISVSGFNQEQFPVSIVSISGFKPISIKNNLKMLPWCIWRPDSLVRVRQASSPVISSSTTTIVSRSWTRSRSRSRSTITSRSRNGTHATRSRLLEIFLVAQREKKREFFVFEDNLKMFKWRCDSSFNWVEIFPKNLRFFQSTIEDWWVFGEDGTQHVGEEVEEIDCVSRLLW